MKHVWIISCLLFVCSCNTVREDFVVNEDYEKLFPSKEIEKPENKRGELLVQLCDPDQALENYKYPGTETPNGADQYKITLMCSFQEKRWDGNLTKDVSAQYKVKYINEKKELVTISCGKRNIGNAGEDADGLRPNVMFNGEKLEISFNVHSGFPLYLSVSGSDGRARMGNLVLEKEKADWCFSVKEGGSYSGTGDLLASVLSAGMVRGIPMKACVEKAVEFLSGAIHDAVEEGTDRNDGVCFEKYLGILTQI